VKFLHGQVPQPGGVEPLHVCRTADPLGGRLFLGPHAASQLQRRGHASGLPAADARHTGQVRRGPPGESAQRPLHPGEDLTRDRERVPTRVPCAQENGQELLPR
jgi:hypothetical protein